MLRINTLKIEEIETTSSETVTKLIEKEQALVKVIESACNDDQHWIFLLQQLAYPYLYRPVLYIDPARDRRQVLDTFTGKWVTREVKERGYYKATEYTKKTSTTLLPANGKIHLYNPKGINAGVLFELPSCKLKGSLYDADSAKYAFHQNAFTNNRWWIKGQPGWDKPPRTVSLKSIRDNNKAIQSRNQTLLHNEILTRLSKRALRAIFSPKNCVTDRLNALHKKYMVRRWLKLDIPVFIITPEEGVISYTEKMIVNDILTVMKSKAQRPYGYDFILGILREISFHAKDIWDEILKTIEKNIPVDLPKEFWLYHAIEKKSTALINVDYSEANNILNELKLTDDNRIAMIDLLVEKFSPVPEKLLNPLLEAKQAERDQHLLTMVKLQYHHAAKHYIKTAGYSAFSESTLVKAFKYLLAYKKTGFSGSLFDDDELTKKVLELIRDKAALDIPLEETSLRKENTREIMSKFGL